jgi:hypothetical protein
MFSCFELLRRNNRQQQWHTSSLLRIFVQKITERKKKKKKKKNTWKKDGKRCHNRQYPNAELDHGFCQIDIAFYRELD